MQHRDGEGHHPPEVHLPVLQHVLEAPSRHLRPDLLPLRDERDAHKRHGLVAVVLLQVLRAHPQQLLHLDDVARPRIGACLDREAAILPNLPRHRLERLHRDVRHLLQPQEEQPQPQAREPSHCVLHDLLFPLQHALHNRLSNVRLPRPHIHQAQRQRRQREELDGRRRVRDHRREDIENVLLLCPRVRHAQPKRRPNPLNRRVLCIHLVCHQRQRRVALAAHVCAHDADGERGARPDVVAVAVGELVNLREARVDIPEQDHAERGGCRHGAVLLVLVDPLAVARHQRVVPEPRVDKRVDKRRREVRPRRVHVGGPSALLRQVRLVDVLGGLGLEDVEVPREAEEVLAERRVADDRHQVVVVGGDVEGAVSREEETQLLLDQLILARVKHLLSERLIVEPDRDAHRLGRLVHLAVDVIDHLEDHRVLGLRHVVCAVCEVKREACVVCISRVLEDAVHHVHLHEEVARVRLAVVLHVEGHDLLHKQLQVIGTLAVGLAHLPLLPNLPRQVLDVLEAPEVETALASAELVPEALPAARARHRHAQDRQHVGELDLVVAVHHRLERLLHPREVRPKELEGLGHRRHGAG
mmetsp:Transcript_24245/g.47023  ORF Transcript_24245/g.47023 Transcript_24245/m.47023 type:complete len:586 (-) Transcript_24245:282-2039(-)